jgi:hypothetical protein
MSLVPSRHTEFLEIGPLPLHLPGARLVSCESGELRVVSSEGECARLGMATCCG